MNEQGLNLGLHCYLSTPLPTCDLRLKTSFEFFNSQGTTLRRNLRVEFGNAHVPLDISAFFHCEELSVIARKWSCRFTFHQPLHEHSFIEFNRTASHAWSMRPLLNLLRKTKQIPL